MKSIIPQGTALYVGVIAGSIKRNSTPEHATIDWEVRYQNQDILGKINTEMSACYHILAQDYPNAQITVNAAETLPVFERQATFFIDLIKRIKN
ncbi:MAG: hypothetical protein SPL08_02800 [Pseudomonadota bacterium]|nr:hypothetical protein [Pseudomonadota bacterium]